VAQDIRGYQRLDGSWALYAGAPGDLSTTIECYFALKLAGDTGKHLERAERFILAHGGIARARVFTRIWLAACGQWRWEDLPAMPIELMLLPARAPVQHLPVRVVGPGDDRAAAAAHERIGRFARCRRRRASRRCAAARPCRSSRAMRSIARSSRSTRCCGATCVWAGGRCAIGPGAPRGMGRRAPRKPTAAGAAFSRPGCTH